MLLGYDTKNMKPTWKRILSAATRKRESIRISTSQKGQMDENTIDLTPDHKMISFENRNLVKERIDDILKNKGYPGSSLGERLKSIPSTQLHSLNDAWEAHKIRNRIAHDGSDFILTKHIAEETISRYRRVFSEFDIT